MSKSMSNMLVCVAVPLLLAAGTAAPARANDDQGRSVTVRTSDLDLSSADGRRKLDRRIRRAARTVCGPAGIGLVQADPCVKLAEQEARQTMRSRQMLAEARKGSSPPPARATITFDPPTSLSTTN